MLSIDENESSEEGRDDNAVKVDLWW